MTDVVVVGSGPIGATAARSAIEHGLGVTLVEAGPAVTDPPGSHLRDTERFRLRQDTYFADLEPYLDTPDGALPSAQTSTLWGGQGILWTNNCPRTVAIERWPGIDDDEWDRLYAIAEGYLAVTTAPDLSVRDGRLRAALEPTLAAGRAVLDQPFAGRRGDPLHAHNVGPAEILGPVGSRVELRTGTVDRLVVDGGRVAGVVADGEELQADHVVVAAGAIGTPELLNRSGLRPSPLGRGVTYHELLVTQIVLDEEVAPPSTEGDPPPRLMIPPTADHRWHTMVLRDTNPLQPVAPDESVPQHRLVEIQAFCAIDPSENDVMEVDPVRFVINPAPAHSERKADLERDVRAMVATLGRSRAGCEPTWMPPGAHLMGTTRMGADPAETVTDLHGRVHGMENLWLATLGVVPTAVAVNPTLTGVALAVRTVEQIART